MLTDEQLAFLRHHKVDSEAVLDARGMRRSEYQAELKRQNKAVALVTEPCNRGHNTRLRLSSGHCMECSPQGVGHWRRYNAPAFIYIASSYSLRLHKVGLSNLASERGAKLINDGYGGTTDWRIVYRRKFEKAGWVEAQAHLQLREFQITREYRRLGHGTLVAAKELFDCDYQVIVTAIESLHIHALGDAWEGR